jgi:hypothetical protein
VIPILVAVTNVPCVGNTSPSGPLVILSPSQCLINTCVILSDEEEDFSTSMGGYLTDIKKDRRSSVLWSSKAHGPLVLQPLPAESEFRRVQSWTTLPRVRVSRETNNRRR